MKLTELFQQYRLKRLRFKSQNTVRLYNHTIRSFEKTLGRTAVLDDLTNENIENHMATIIERGGSPASANKDRSQLLAMWRFAATNRIIDRWPDVQIAMEPDAIPMGWMPDDVEKLFMAIEKEPGSVGNVQSVLWWSAIFSVLFDTGERIGAIRALNKIHFQDSWLLVPAEFRKGKRRDRLYPISTKTSELLSKICRIDKTRKELFYFPYSNTYLYKKLNVILERAGLPTNRRSKFHRCRTTVASAVAQAGGDPTAALDHASPKTTKKYLDPRIVGAVKVSEILANYLATPKKLDRRDQKDRRKSG